MEQPVSVRSDTVPVQLASRPPSAFAWSTQQPMGPVAHMAHGGAFDAASTGVISTAGVSDDEHAAAAAGSNAKQARKRAGKGRSMRDLAVKRHRRPRRPSKDPASRQSGELARQRTCPEATACFRPTYRIVGRAPRASTNASGVARMRGPIARRPAGSGAVPIGSVEDAIATGRVVIDGAEVGDEGRTVHSVRAGAERRLVRRTVPPSAAMFGWAGAREASEVAAGRQRRKPWNSRPTYMVRCATRTREGAVLRRKAPRRVRGGSRRSDLARTNAEDT